jgi:hypothetical protein
LVDKSNLKRVEDGKGCCGHGDLPQWIAAFC